MTEKVDALPKHVALIMDGNRRWAKEHHLPIYAGHKKVVEERVEELIEEATKLNIPYITFWAFSTENWRRERSEVTGIMRLFKWALSHKAKRLVDKGARVKMIGDLSRFSTDIQKGFSKLMKDSEHNTRIIVTFALNYGGRDEIVRAVNELATSDWRRATREKIEAHLDTKGLPDPDLIIRTGGEQRLSGFMLWQAEYSELYFTQKYMPDFGAAELEMALEEYKNRQRRRGK